MNNQIKKLYLKKEKNQNKIEKAWDNLLMKTVDQKALKQLKDFQDDWKNHKDFDCDESGFISSVSALSLDEFWEIEEKWITEDFMDSAKRVLEELTENIINFASYSEDYIKVGCHSAALYNEDREEFIFHSPDSSETFSVNPENYDTQDNALRHGLKQLKDNCKGVSLGEVFFITPYGYVEKDSDLSQYLNKIETREFSQ